MGILQRMNSKLDTILTDVTIVRFPDAALEAAVRTAIGVPTGNIYQSYLLPVTSFNASGLGIVDLSGMEYWTSLTTLWLSVNSIVDLTPLAGLTSLTDLGLSDNSIVDLTPLAGLTSLTSLGLSANSIVSLTPLAGLTSLQYLWLAANSIVSPTPLAGLTNLQYLWLSANSIVDLTPLAGLTSLTDLGLSDNSIVDLTPLAGLTSLTYLDLGANSIVSLTPLAGLTSLITLGLSVNSIVSISALVGVMASGAIFIVANPLSVAAYHTDIPAIQATGVGVSFDAEPTPAAIAILPTGGTTAGGTAVDITGTGFLYGATATIGGNPCTSVVFVSSTELTALTPAGIAGAQDVVVTNDVQFGTAVGAFTYS